MTDTSQSGQEPKYVVVALSEELHADAMRMAREMGKDGGDVLSTALAIGIPTLRRDWRNEQSLSEIDVNPE